MTTTNEKRQAREAAEAAQCANHRDDIAALCDLILNQAKDCTCQVTLASRRRTLIELAAGPMFTPGCSEAVIYEAIEDNLEMLRATNRVTIHGANGKKTTVSIPPRDE